MEYLLLLIFHDCLVMIFNYFYYIRYKPPTFNLRLSVLFIPLFSFLVEMSMTIKNVVTFIFTKRKQNLQFFLQNSGEEKFQLKILYHSYNSRREKCLAYFAAIPLITVVPLFNIFEVLCTFFIQLRTYADLEESFDPKFNGTLYSRQALDNTTVPCNSYCEKGTYFSLICLKRPVPKNGTSDFTVIKMGTTNVFFANKFHIFTQRRIFDPICNL